MITRIKMTNGEEMTYRGLDAKWRGIIHRRLVIVTRNDLSTGDLQPQKIVAEFPASSVASVEFSEHYE